MGFKDVLKSAFPFISVAASMGGPLGVMAANMAGKALGVDKVEPTTDGITAAITTAQATDPDAMLKLQQAEDAFKLQMAQMGIDSAEKMAALDNEDRASARAREIAVRDKTPQILAYVDLMAFLIALVLLWKVPVPPTVHDLVLIMLTTLANNLVQERSYFFGSSTGSSAKSATIEKLAQSATEK